MSVTGREGAGDQQIIEPRILVIVDGIHADLAEHGKAGPLQMV
jgi:hypothetical protein